MASYNKVFLMGNLTRDPQVKHLPSQMVVVEFGLAVNRKYKTADGQDKEEVAFVDCTAFGRQAETISQYCTRGKPIFVEGRLKFDTWDDRGGGGKRSKLTVVVEGFQFLGRAGENGEQRPGDFLGMNSNSPERAGHASGPTAARTRSSAGEQAKMFPNEDRKAWRGRDKAETANAGAAAGAPSGTGGAARGRGKAPAATPIAKADAPFGEEQHFDEADIPF
jgi:single-strand DNA-binding protein